MNLLALLSAVALLSASEVGPQAVPAQIEPVEAPFEMPVFERPVFPKRTRTVWMRRRGMSTRRIQRTIDRVSRRGGGTVVIPPGVWQTGRISLKSHVNLYLSEGTELHFSGEVKDYQPAVFTRDQGVELYTLGACFYANGAEHIALTGHGRVVGPDTDCEIFQRNSKDDPLVEILSYELPDRIFDGRDGGLIIMPKTFAPIHCHDVFVEGITFDRGLYWNLAPQYCDHVVIRGCTVNSYGHGTTDGVDIDSCTDVLVEYCAMDNQDDCFTFKSGRGEDGRRVNRPTERVVIRRCLALRGSGGIVFGTEIAGGVRDVYLCDCVFNGTNHAVRFKTRRPRGGFVENVLVERVRADVLYQALWCEMLGSERWVGELAHRYPAREVTPLTPWFRHFTIRDMDITGCETLVEMAGLPEMPLRDVAIARITGTCGKIGAICDAEGFSMEDVQVRTQDDVLTLDNVSESSFTGVRHEDTQRPVRIEKVAGPCRNIVIK